MTCRPRYAWVLFAQNLSSFLNRIYFNNEKEDAEWLLDWAVLGSLYSGNCHVFWLLLYMSLALRSLQQLPQLGLWKMMGRRYHSNYLAEEYISPHLSRKITQLLSQSITSITCSTLLHSNNNPTIHDTVDYHQCHIPLFLHHSLHLLPSNNTHGNPLSFRRNLRASSSLSRWHCPPWHRRLSSIFPSIGLHCRLRQLKANNFETTIALGQMMTVEWLTITSTPLLTSRQGATLSPLSRPPFSPFLSTFTTSKYYTMQITPTWRQLACSSPLRWDDPLWDRWPSPMSTWTWSNGWLRQSKANNSK